MFRRQFIKSVFGSLAFLSSKQSGALVLNADEAIDYESFNASSTDAISASDKELFLSVRITVKEVWYDVYPDIEEFQVFGLATSSFRDIFKVNLYFTNSRRYGRRNMQNIMNDLKPGSEWIVSSDTISMAENFTLYEPLYKSCP